MQEQVRAVGLIRVSEVAGRDGESFASPQDQRAAIERVCIQRDWLLTDVFEELDVSAYKRPLDARPGLTAAVRLIEARQAHVVVACYFDRLFRQIDVQRQVLKRVEAAGGEVYACDIGEVSHRTASRKLTATMLGAISEYYAELIREKTLPAKERAVARGEPPYPLIVAGYRLGPTRRIEVDPTQAPLVQQAFELRAAGATIVEVRDFLRQSDVLVPAMRKPHTPQPIDHQRTRTLLSSRFVLGELRHGAFVNLDSHPAIVDASLWSRVQHLQLARGRAPRSERLLARLGIARCATCGRPLSVGAWFKKSSGERVATYGCTQPDRACSRPATINAEALEDEVTEKVREALRDRAGLATHASEIAQLEAVLAERQATLERAIATLQGFEDIVGTRERLRQLRESVDEVEARLAPLRAVAIPARRLRPSTDWALLTASERRDLVRALVERIELVPGRGAGRVRIQLFGE
jgi:DNA invertase Pin-like site-specific DNA recombinase